MMEVLVAREVAGEDTVTVRAWLVADGARVEVGTELVEVTTSKASFIIEAEETGYLAHACHEGDRLPVGGRLAVIQSERPESKLENAAPDSRSTTISKKARQLLEQHGLDPELFVGKAVVRASDVEALLGQQNQPELRFGDQVLDPALDWEAVENSPEFLQLQSLMQRMRQKLKVRHHRHVPSGTLLYDRWRLAQDYGFGEGTSVYDECLILGDVTLGKKCWVGPYTVLDGSGGKLRLGDHVQVGSGTHLYTHNTIENCLTGGKARPFGAATSIGSCCFISPMSVIGAGSVLGDHCFVACGSYVEGNFPSYSYIAGTPARRVGRVEVEGARARLVLDQPVSSTIEPNP